jgi:hypothetical protein
MLLETSHKMQGLMVPNPDGAQPVLHPLLCCGSLLLLSNSGDLRPTLKSPL